MIFVVANGTHKRIRGAMRKRGIRMIGCSKSWTGVNEMVKRPADLICRVPCSEKSKVATWFAEKKPKHYPTRQRRPGVIQTYSVSACPRTNR